MHFLSRLFRRFKKDQEPDTMKYLIVGLGNMGPDYDNTRHNAGFDVVDKLAREFELTWKDERLGFISEFKFKGRTFVLLKPSTFMNLSGKAVTHWLTKLNIPRKNLLIIVDDTNLPFGTIRLKGKGSDGGHNGLKDLSQSLGGNNYPRLRIGIGSKYYKGQMVNYVLGQWSDDEQSTLPEILEKSAEAVKKFGTIGLNFAMTEVNVKEK